MQEQRADLETLADRIARAIPKFDPAAQQIAVQTYRLLAEGMPVPPRAIAVRTHLPENHVRETLKGWTGVFYDASGAVIGFWGLAVAPMPHRFAVDGRTLHTWCAWDSLFIPEILGRTARVESVDPVTKERISLAVGPGGVQDASPPAAVVSFLTPRTSFDQDVIVNFCHFIHFFASEESGAKWVAAHPGTFLLSLDDAFALGRLTNRRNFGDALG